MVIVFPSDTVYGLGCDPDDAAAVERLYSLKGRPEGKPAAVMFFDVSLALPLLAPRTRELAARLLPGAVTLLVPNPRRLYPLACGADASVLGLRVPDAPAPYAIKGAIMQTSANFGGGPDARTLDEVPLAIREGADVVIDGGELPGTPSTVIDLTRYEATGEWSIVREGAVPSEAIGATVELVRA